MRPAAPRAAWSRRRASRSRRWSAPRARDVVFTSGGTEANMLALSPALGDTLLVSAIEHPSVPSGGRFAAAEEIPVTADGVVDLAALERMLAGRTRPLVSLMLANNETGVIQPVAEAAALVHAAGGLLHVDAVQGPGRIACDFSALGADLMTLSSHKIGGPQGVGALIRRDGLPLDAADQGRRPGARRSRRHRECGRHRRLWRRRRGGAAGLGRPRPPGWRRCATGSRPGSRPWRPRRSFSARRRHGCPTRRCFRCPGMKAETAVIAFDLEGVAVSSGAACSSGKVAPSHVLAAMGVARSWHGAQSV